MPLDRDAVLKKAEKFLRQGKLDGAIEEYVRLVEDQPRDWNAINALGDLYVRAGNSDRAVEQFTRIANYLFNEGFFPKAAALYKKALKVHSVHEPTLLRLGEIAVKQGLLADAKLYFRQLADQRRFKGDQAGAAECLIRLASLDEADAESKLAGARAAQQIGNASQAATLFKEAAEQLTKQNRQAEALDLFVEAAQLSPDDQALRAMLAAELVKAGQIERAQQFLTREAAGDDPDLLLALAKAELTAGRDEEAKTLLTRLLTVASDRHDDVLQFALELARGGHVERGFGCVELLADASLLDGHWQRAAAGLRAFGQEITHVPALMKLVEVCVDGGDDHALREAQAHLADAYLKEGRGAEARVIAEDLVQHDPSSDAHVRRLRAALELLGVEDIDRAIQERLNPEEPLSMLPDDLGLDLLETIDAGPALQAPSSEEPQPVEEQGETLIEEPVLVESPPPTPQRLAVSEPADEAFVLDLGEIDLSTALADIGAIPAAPPKPSPTPVPAPGPRPAAAPPPAATLIQAQAPAEAEALPPPPTADPAVASAPGAGAQPRDLESVFEDIRTRVEREQLSSDAGAQYERALSHIREGRTDEAIADLQTVARTPTLRFKAAAQLGRLYVAGGDLRAAVEWFERAVEAPAPTSNDAFAVLYELATVLEELGETARALAILIELDGDAGSYRDVRMRIESLTREQAGSRGA